MNDPKWLAEARKYIGERELKGQKHNPLILQMWRDIKRGGIKDDETPWCAAFTGAVLERCGIKSTRFESAGSYLGWGEQLLKPALGCVVVFKRDGGGHVGFVVGQTKIGDLLVLGGNQSDAVNVRAFPRSRVSGYRWPVGVSDIPDFNLPERVNISFSISEA
ncbi:TIGR02594 family protein [Escherichia coli]|uniref:TIGR02594 family protein n=1 Tax=Escherichia coli TaxID=562 RepID=UPI0034C60185